MKGKTYNGKAQTQAPVVKVGGRTLKKGTDYTLSYKNNVKAGTAKVIITGKGNYAGSKSVAFKINKKKSSGGVVCITATWEKYHKGGCRYLKHSKYAISKSQAISEGYSACKVCKP